MQWMKAEFSRRRMHEKFHERSHEKMEMEDPDPVISLFYIWQFLTPAVISSEGKWIFSYKDTEPSFRSRDGCLVADGASGTEGRSFYRVCRLGDFCWQ